MVKFYCIDKGYYLLCENYIKKSQQRLLLIILFFLKVHNIYMNIDKTECLWWELFFLSLDAYIVKTIGHQQQYKNSQ
jgi:hypothetical protein